MSIAIAMVNPRRRLMSTPIIVIIPSFPLFRDSLDRNFHFRLQFPAPIRDEYTLAPPASSPTWVPLGSPVHSGETCRGLAFPWRAGSSWLSLRDLQR